MADSKESTEASTQSQPEPSMEEILASIRRIISEDTAKLEPAVAGQPAGAASSVVAPPPESRVSTPVETSVLDLTQEVRPDGSIADIHATPVLEVEEMAPPPAPPRAVAVAAGEDTLLSTTAAHATSSALGSLAGLMRHHSTSTLPLGDSSRTLESMVLELMKPMLKAWLDQNLPGLVHQVVEKEIQKISRSLE